MASLSSTDANANANVSSSICRLVPGPTTMAPEVLAAYGTALGSPDTDPAFWDDYLALERALQHLLHTRNAVAIQSGEGMVALWGAMRSTIQVGDVVVCAVNGVFGQGFADMAKALGATVHVVTSDWRSPLAVDRVVHEIKKRDPVLVTVVHCETPSGVINQLARIGQAVAEDTTQNTLLLVDFVSSAGAVPLEVDDWGIDLGLLAPQKVLSAPPALGITTVSTRAWARIQHVGYQGYDALLPFYQVAQQEPRLMPYTHNWHAVRATLVACESLLQRSALQEEDGEQVVNNGGGDGVVGSIQRHAEVAAYCRDLITRELGLELYCQEEAAASPTVTAVCLPDGMNWRDVDAELRQRNVFLAGSYGPLAGKVFRIGHMGSQADKALVARAVGTLRVVLDKLR